MNILDAMLAAQNGGAVNQLGRQFGLNDDQVTSALSALVPALAGGFAQNAAGGGLDGLLGALAGGRHAGYLDDLASLAQPSTTADGNGILGHVLGSKDVSRQVAVQAAASSGVGADILKKMLPVLATVLMGALAKGQLGGGSQLDRGQAGLGGGGSILDMLGPLLGGGAGSGGGGGLVSDILGGVLGKMLGGR